jgi:hypothetical protein
MSDATSDNTQASAPQQPQGQSLQMRSLLVSNAIAAVALAFVAGGVIQGSASAQPANVAGAGDRARGDYTMVSGRFREGGGNAVYVIDSSNQEIVALRWDSSKQQMAGVGYRSIANDARAARGR